MAENIKARVSFYLEGTNRPISSVQEFEQLKRVLWVTPESPDENIVEDIDVEGVPHEIIDVRFSISKETDDLHLKYGVDSTLVGDGMPYNFSISVYLRPRS